MKLREKKVQGHIWMQYHLSEKRHKLIEEHGWLITSHRILCYIITHPCSRFFVLSTHVLNTLRPRQNGRHFADDTLKRIFLNENVRISITISLKFVPKGPINKNPALVQIMAGRRSGGKPLSEPMMVSLLTYICVTRPQWVKCPYQPKECRAPSQYKDRLIYVWRFPC